ncbi:RteC domain-containing protein [Chitinophaga barathri]|nr:RteC domain-containing protein [Chitinophaga barathri]
MPSHYQQILAKLELHLPEYTSYADISIAARAAGQCQVALEETIAYWQQNDFRDAAEELSFFRHTYPAALAHWMFWSQVHLVEEIHPLGTAEMSILFYSGLLKGIAPIISRRQGVAAWLENMPEDKLSFFFFNTPTILQLAAFPNLPANMVLPRNEHSQHLASSWAYQRLADYLMAQIDRLSGPGRVGRGQHQLRWVLSKASLTELVYALHEYGAFDGRPEISRIASAVSEWFGVDLGNIYKAYEGIRIRKKDRTPFISGLVTALLRRLDHDDLHAL